MLTKMVFFISGPDTTVTSVTSFLHIPLLATRSRLQFIPHLSIPWSPKPSPLSVLLNPLYKTLFYVPIYLPKLNCTIPHLMTPSPFTRKLAEETLL